MDDGCMRGGVPNLGLFQWTIADLLRRLMKAPWEAYLPLSIIIIIGKENIGEIVQLKDQ